LPTIVIKNNTHFCKNNFRTKWVRDYCHLAISKAQSINILCFSVTSGETIDMTYIHSWPDILLFLRIISNPFRSSYLLTKNVNYF